MRSRSWITVMGNSLSDNNSLMFCGVRVCVCVCFVYVTVSGLSQLRGAWLSAGQPGSGALRDVVQRRLSVGAAHDPQQTHSSAEGRGLHKVHTRGAGDHSTNTHTRMPNNIQWLCIFIKAQPSSPHTSVYAVKRDSLSII